MKKLLTAAAIAASLFAASTASAAVVVFGGGSVTPASAPKVTTVALDAGVTVTAIETLLPGESAQFVFTANENLKVSTIAISGSGNNFGIDLDNIEFGFTAGTLNSFLADGTTTVFPGGSGAASAVASLVGGMMNAGDTFTIFWEDGIAAPVALTASFSTTAVPVPAALPLMVGALGMLGVARRKKSKAA